MLLIIDNYDSFTYNLYQYFCELGIETQVQRNDAISIDDIEKLSPTHLVISPGPCTPNEAGISLKVIEHFAGRIPILGVCLGHQAIAQVFGGQVLRAPRVMHGKNSLITHSSQGVFSELNNPLNITRYHSLIVDADSLPNCFDVTSWVTESDQQLIMGIKHKTLPIEGVQFHPESIQSEQGLELLANFYNQNLSYSK